MVVVMVEGRVMLSIHLSVWSELFQFSWPVYNFSMHIECVVMDTKTGIAYSASNSSGPSILSATLNMPPCII